MGIDSRISLYFSQLYQFSIVRDASRILNDWGQGDGLAFLCILLMIGGYLVGKSYLIKSGAAGILVLTLSGAVVQVLKHLIGRARPQMNLGDFHFLGPNLIKNGFESFPSGHAFSAFTLASFFASLYPRTRWFLYPIAAAIAIIGRVVASHHFLSDVVAGGALGVVLGLWGARKFRIWISRPSAVASPSLAVSSPPLMGGDKGEGGNVFGSPLKDILAVAVFSSVILFTGLSNSGLWDRDETEYAQAAVEM
ncbi:MAG: hypothetical protein A3J70_15445, partial [Elusimicrobia bacterium RIFCSPHIGHO2_02_FULL_61_10]